jgi:TonB family protein
MSKLKHMLLCLALGSCLIYASDRPQRAVTYSENPEYPEIAKRMDLHGTVKLKIWIKPDGSIRRVEYVGGHPVLAESALKAVKNWKYAPALIESNTVVEVKF